MLSPGWEAVEVEFGAVVVPVDDLIEHEREEFDCVCGPRVWFNETGTRACVTHHSLDGRELHE